MKKIGNGISKRIAKLRKDKGLSQEAFGLEIEVTGAYVSLMESGKRSPSHWLVEGIAKVFGVDADYLRTGRKGTK